MIRFLMTMFLACGLLLAIIRGVNYLIYKKANFGKLAIGVAVAGIIGFFFIGGVNYLISNGFVLPTNPSSSSPSSSSPSSSSSSSSSYSYCAKHNKMYSPDGAYSGCPGCKKKEWEDEINKPGGLRDRVRKW